MQKEKLSALMDGEALDSELFSALSKDAELQKSWERYHLIRDTMRGDVGEHLMLFYFFYLFAENLNQSSDQKSKAIQ